MNTIQESHTDRKEAAVTRLESFSDGVFAFAMTLLVLQITIPQLGVMGERKNLWLAILSQWPSIFSFVISFVIIGIIWANHNDMYQYIKRSNHLFRMLNIIFLLAVVFIPYPTAILGQYIQSPENRTIAVGIYTGTMLFFAIMYTVVWAYAVNKNLVDKNLSKSFLSSLTKRYFMGIALYLISFIFAFIRFEISIGIIIVLAIMYFLPHGVKVE